MSDIDSPLGAVKSVRWPIAGLKILDIGCGGGGVAKQLAAEGAEVTGIDPLDEAIRTASAAVPQAKFITAGAEALPFDAGTFDIALMVNSLHHVPEPMMRAALREAMRVLKRDGALIVMEPLASGNSSEALKLVEDETAVRQAAQETIEAAASSGEMERVGSLNYVRRDAFRNVDEFLDRIASVLPARRDVIERDRRSITNAVLALAERDGDGRLMLTQPIKVDVLMRA
jgi:2-polyprenyl-3-methyl-5-hydroxy-6-metoxy-1,4-benzoquinol methylase